MTKQEFFFMMLEQDLVIILETARIIAIALSPVTPSLSWRIYAQLGYSKDQFDEATWVSLYLSIYLSHMWARACTQTLLWCLIYVLFCRETPSGVDLRVARSWLNLNQCLLGLKTKLKWKTNLLQWARRLRKVKGSWNKLKKLLVLRCFTRFWIILVFTNLCNLKLILLLIYVHKYLNLGTYICKNAFMCTMPMYVYKFWMENSISFFGNKARGFKWSWDVNYCKCEVRIY